MSFNSLKWFSIVIGFVCSSVFGLILGLNGEQAQTFVPMGLLAATIVFVLVIPLVIQVASVLTLNKMGYLVERDKYRKWSAVGPKRSVHRIVSVEALLDSIIELSEALDLEQ